MNARTMVTFNLKTLILTLLLFALYSIDFAGLGLSETVVQTPLAVLLMAFLDTAALTYAILCARTGGWKLAGRVALLFFGVKSFLVLIEAVYLSDLLPPALVRTLLLNGIITAVLFSLAAVQLHDRWAAREPVSTPLTLSMLG